MNRSPWRTGVAKRVPRSLIGALAPESISHFGKHYGHNFQTWWQKGVKTPWFLEFLVSPALFPLKKQPNGRIIWHAWLEYHLLEEDYDHLHFYRATNADIKGQWTGKSGLCWIYIYILQRSAKIILAVNLGCDSIHANPKQSQRSISLAYEFAVIGCTFGWPATYISFHHVQTVFPGEIRLFPSFQSDHQHKQPFRLLKQFSRIDAESRSHGFVGKFHNFGTIEGCWVLGRWDCYMLCGDDEHSVLCWL